MANYTMPTCPTNCGNIDMPDYALSTCDDNYTLELSEIQYLYLVAASSDIDGNPEPGAKPTDWTSASDWASVLGTSDSGGATIRKIEGIGNKDATEDEEADLPGGRSKVINRVHQIVYDVTDMSTTNYDFFNQFTCGGTVYFWYQTRGNYLYGGGEGVRATIKSANFSLDRGDGSQARWVLTLEWNGISEPPRIASPI